LHPPFPQQMSITWNVTTLNVSDQGLETARCRDCRTMLNVHQPDENRPEQLLATCGGCGSWYLIVVGERDREAFLFDLPNVSLIRAAVSSQRPKAARKRSPRHTPGSP
jgi:hypothetical protein